MSDTPNQRPDQSEFAPYAQVYVDEVPAGAVDELLLQQMDATAALLSAANDEWASTYTYAPGKWTVKEMLAHISDTERIMSTRALRIARGDTTPLPGFEQDGYVPFSGANERTVGSLVDELRAVRGSTLALLAGLPADAWSRRGEVSGRSVTVRGLVFTLAGHERHHYRILRERYGLSVAG